MRGASDSSVAAFLIVIALATLLCGLPMGIWTYFNRSGHPMVFLISEGYQGPVRLIIDKERGIDVPLEEGTYTYRIPQDGTLRIKDASPFRQWHSQTAHYTNNEQIPMDHEGTLLAGAVSFHGLGCHSIEGQDGKRVEVFEYFVGTKAELEKHRY
jgi:hypothetical protein